MDYLLEYYEDQISELQEKVNELEYEVSRLDTLTQLLSKAYLKDDWSVKLPQ